MRKLLAAAAIGAVVITTTTSCSAKHSGTNSAETSFVAGDGSTVLLASSKRGEPIELSGQTLEGTALDISSWRGNVVVVNLWASWCGPCRSEALTLEKSYKEFAEKEVKFLGLNTRDGLAAAQAFSRRFPTGYPSVQDQDGALTLAFGNLGPAATPSTLILDRQGRVAARILGPVTQAQLRDVLRAIVDEK